MGGLRDDFGKICIETDHDGFTVHASYGFRPKRVLLEELRPGDSFIYQGDPYKLRALYETYAIVWDERHKVAQEFSLKTGVEVDDQEYDDTLPLARLWNDYPHPVFAVEDLPDLIKALEDVRKHYGVTA